MKQEHTLSLKGLNLSVQTNPIDQMLRFETITEPLEEDTGVPLRASISVKTVPLKLYAW